MYVFLKNRKSVQLGGSKSKAREKIKKNEPFFSKITF